MTIGGYVKADWGWVDQNRNMDTVASGSVRKGTPGVRERADYEYGVMDARSFDTRLSFLVKGPDAWGAKTSAYIEVDFSSGNNRERHAFMKFDWANDSLIIGQTWANYNLVPIPIIFTGVTELGEAKNNRLMQVRWTHMFGKNVSTSLAALSPANWGTTARGDSSKRSMTPYLAGSADFTSDALGKIGTTKLAFGTSGVIGYTKETYNSTDDTLTVKDKNVKAWGVAAYATVPIIPEKNNSKQFAWGMGAGGQVFSNISDVIYSSISLGLVNAYARGNGVVEVAPTYAAWWGTTNFFLTDKVSLNAYYASIRLVSPSSMLKNNTAVFTTPTRNDTYALNVAYDVNPAIRLVAEAQQVYTMWGRDAAIAADGSDRGKMNVFRLGAWYFF